MADYFPVLSRAIAGLENNTGEARRAVYERARAAIIRQLRAIDPPLSEEDISRERMQLEEAIRRVEANAAGAAPTKPAPRAEPAAPEPQRRPQGPTPRDQTEEPRREQAPETDAPAGPAKARPATRPDGRPIIQPAGAAAGETKRRKSGVGLAVAALVVVLIGAGLFLARGQIAGMLGGGSQTEVATAPQQPAEPATPPATDGKSDDRLTQDAPAPAAPPATETQQPTPAAPQQPAPEPEREVARGPEPTAPQPPAEPAPEQKPAGPAVAQRAVLYEEGPNQQSGEALAGTVLWRNESVSGGSNQPLETAIRGDVEIPGRNLRAAITIRRNVDATLPASHTIEIQFTLPENFPNAGVSNVPGVLMKADESARGAAVAGLSVRVTNGFFLIGLSNLDTERSVNEQLLRDRNWIDIPILYDNGRRAVLTLEKGTPGGQAFNEAFTAWRSASANTTGGATAR